MMTYGAPSASSRCAVLRVAPPKISMHHRSSLRRVSSPISMRSGGGTRLPLIAICAAPGKDQHFFMHTSAISQSKSGPTLLLERLDLLPGHHLHVLAKAATRRKHLRARRPKRRPSFLNSILDAIALKQAHLGGPLPFSF